MKEKNKRYRGSVQAVRLLVKRIPEKKWKIEGRKISKHYEIIF